LLRLLRLLKLLQLLLELELLKLLLELLLELLKLLLARRYLCGRGDGRRGRGRDGRFQRSAARSLALLLASLGAIDPIAPRVDPPCGA
jgi:hypothetical protein